MVVVLVGGRQLGVIVTLRDCGHRGLLGALHQAIEQQSQPAIGSRLGAEDRLQPRRPVPLSRGKRPRERRPVCPPVDSTCDLRLQSVLPVGTDGVWARQEGWLLVGRHCLARHCPRPTRQLTTPPPRSHLHGDTETRRGGGTSGFPLWTWRPSRCGLGVEVAAPFFLAPLSSKDRPADRIRTGVTDGRCES